MHLFHIVPHGGGKEVAHIFFIMDGLTDKGGGNFNFGCVYKGKFRIIKQGMAFEGVSGVD